MSTPPATLTRPVSRQALIRQREIARRRKRARIRRNRLFAGSIVGVIGLVGFTAVNAATGNTRPSTSRHVATPVLLSSITLPTHHIPGKLAAMPWPAKGQSAVAISGIGLMSKSTGESSVPIASITKMMTAYLILTDHPITPGSDGPVFTETKADVAAYIYASQTDESNAPVALGEKLTEYQLLEALLMPSADNIADRLAIWDAGTIAKFVVKMNATAKALHLTATHYADASGVNPGSRSTASDQAQLGALLMENPVVRSIVSQPRAAFPVAGTIWNVNPALGHDGIIGIKSGYTSHAMGCLANAAWEIIGGKKVLVVAVTLTQPDGLYGAARVNEALIGKATGTLVAYHPLVPGATVAQATLPWSTVTSPASVDADVTVVGWPGLVIHASVVPEPATASVGLTGHVGRVEFTTGNAKTVLGSARLIATSPPVAPDGWQPS